MAERPDLDAILRRLDSRKRVAVSDWTVKQIAQMNSDAANMARYCRELEAENKRLRQDQDKADQRHAKWLAAAGDCGP